MTSGYETVMALLLAGLKASPPLVPNVGNIRRAHRTAVPKEKAPAIHLIDDDDTRDKGDKCGNHEARFTISVFVRSDDGASPADPYKRSAVARVRSTALPNGCKVNPPTRVRIDTETADTDASRVDIDFTFTYATGDPWSLDLPT